MDRLKILNLRENSNKWVIGSPPAVTDSSFQSEVLQAAYANDYEAVKYILDEEMHRHPEPIEEFYFVLRGRMTLLVEDETYHINEKEILRVPANYCHKISDMAEDIEFLNFRAPPSDRTTKMTCK